MAENPLFVKNVPSKKKVASFVTAAVALELVGLFGVSYATDAYGPIQMMAATTIFVDGTKDILPTGDSQAPDRMRDALGGIYDRCAGQATCAPGAAQNVYVTYPRDFGILTGGVGYDQSKAVATTNTLAAIRTAQHQNPGDPVVVVGYSQGAGAQADTLAAIEANNLAHPDPADPLHIDTTNLSFVLAGNSARNDGGLFARLPAGVYVPLLGLSFGASTNPSTDPNAPQVIMISKQYDGASDWPKYVVTNPLAAANAALGFMYVHNGYYADTDISDLDTDKNGKLSDAEIAAADPHKYIITKNGNIVDVVVVNQPGDMPIEQPLKALGVPNNVILAIDPLLRAVVDAGYQRPTDGKYPATPVYFGLVPPPGKTVADLFSIASATQQTEENLKNLGNVNLLQPNQLQAATITPEVVTPPVPPTPPAPSPAKPKFFKSLFVEPAPAPAAAPVPTETPLRVAEEVPVEQTQRAATTVTNSVSTPVKAPGGAAATAAGAAIKSVVNGAVTATQNLVTAVGKALTPKPAAASSPSAPADSAPSGTSSPSSSSTG